MRFKESPGKALLEVQSLSFAHSNSEVIFRVRPSVPTLKHLVFLVYDWKQHKLPSVCHLVDLQHEIYF